MTVQPRRHAAGCDCDAAAAGLMPLDEALRRGLALADPVTGTETLPLSAALGRITASPARAPVPLPPFDNSGMDGYALRLADLTGEGPWTLPVAGAIAAGDAPREDLPPGAALRILTGAPVPAAADAVIMQEKVRRAGGSICFDHRPAPGENIRRRGEDLREGAEILPAGVEIGPREAAALAAIGAGAVALRRRLRVAIFATGSELREPGEPLAPGQIWNSNRYMLRAALDRPWIALRDLGRVADDPVALAESLQGAARDADMIVTTGGISVGDADHMPRLLRDLGGDIHAMRIAMKPGKPVTLGQLGQAIYVGLPGNPVSAFVTWQVLGWPVLCRRAGLARSGLPRMVLPLAHPVRRKPGRQEFRPARLIRCPETGDERLELLSTSYSARVALLAAADGLAVLPADMVGAGAGERLEFLRF
ncbi:gephyrin-like molybdotransferase Glp [Actibacterium sp. MT2.3-13A]|uniref:molybdopterin molybdotransferase MoeA n=1 Tax=Actibacterium sp. MT2.3-13A TaxID=2828332 RepID=UPI001BA83AB1|nr:gephyrin-like molybdotransferase Glp [Actibacterium sp. MT2.3-13A]